MLFVVALLVGGSPTWADPPPWAPAHGYYKDKPAKTPKSRREPRRYDDNNRRDDAELLPWLIGGAASTFLLGDRCNREALGAVVGGVIGGVAGSRIGTGDTRGAATVAGALVGVLVGKFIGQSMDRADQYCTGQSLEYARDRQSVHWENPGDRAQYSVTPMNYYEARDGRYCREFTSEASVGGQRHHTYGTACRQPDGAWEIVN
jgi:surface antigen